jgi:hypothetical protein
LVMNPQIGPYPPERHLFAIELCRVYAALGGLRRPGLTGLAIGLFYAGLVLTDKTFPLGIYLSMLSLIFRIYMDSRTSARCR